MKFIGYGLLAATMLIASCGGSGPEGGNAPMQEKPARPSGGTTEQATFGAGCFWCVEAVFRELDGVQSVEPGYAGGATDNPTYQAVCSGETGHAEVAQITYDPARISFVELLEVFFQTHDPTTLNRQGADAGTQYRSAVFYQTEEQRTLAEKAKRELDTDGAFDAPIVTEIVPLKRFFPAEEYHRNYFERNPEQGYCRMVIRPKVEKFRKVFREKLKR